MLGELVEIWDWIWLYSWPRMKVSPFVDGTPRMDTEKLTGINQETLWRYRKRLLYTAEVSL